jgi:hypothetical protein
MWLIKFNADQLKTQKQLAIARKDERPFLVAIPAVEVKEKIAPKAKERVLVGADEATIVGEGLNELQAIVYGNQELKSFEIAADGKSVRVLGVKNAGVTSVAKTQQIELRFKDGSKATVPLEVVTAKVETVSK